MKETKTGFWIKANLLEKETKETKIIFLWWNHNNLYEISYIPFFFKLIL